MMPVQHASLQASFDAYDVLPAAVRRELQDAPVNLDSQAVAQLLRQYGEAETLVAIRNSIAVHVRK